ncbi:hypothetical protein ACWKSP_26215 [Micromonosporaceae bacterium Da 78-11]
MSRFRAFAEQVVADYDENLLDYGPEEQAARVVTALEKLDGRRALRPHIETIDAFGFGAAQTCFATGDGASSDAYLRLLPLASAIGISPHRADALAGQRHLWNVNDQRDKDEKSGVLGWDYMNDWVSLDLNLIVDNLRVEPDAGGRRAAFVSDWLVSLDRLPELMMLSPWGKEFMDNASPMFAHAFQASGLAAKAHEVQSVVKQVADDGEVSWVPSGRTLADALAEDRLGLTQDEARARAFRGPSLGGAS